MFSLNTVLFPTDYSEGSERLCPLACDLALARGARLIAMHVVEPPLYCGEVNAPMPPSQVVRDRVEHWMKQHRGRGEMPPMECRVSEGFAWEQIPRVAVDCGCDLIVMGSEGKSGLGRTLIGSVAESVARQSPCPVLICKQPAGTRIATTREAGQPPFPTVIFPVDLSDRAREALAVVSALVAPGSRLIVQHVVAAVDHASPAARSSFLDLLHERYPADRVAPATVVYRLSGGDPVEEIRRAAEDTHCDLIVMSSHGRKGVRRLLMGSVAEEVFRTVGIPVVIVHSTRPLPSPVPGRMKVAIT